MGLEGHWVKIGRLLLGLELCEQIGAIFSWACYIHGRMLFHIRVAEASVQSFS